MTTEEKFEKAVEFIKSIERLDKSQYDNFNMHDLEKEVCAYCDERDETVDVKLQWPRQVSLNTKYIDCKIIDDLSDKAWHVLASITE